MLVRGSWRQLYRTRVTADTIGRLATAEGTRSEAPSRKGRSRLTALLAIAGGCFFRTGTLPPDYPSASTAVYLARAMRNVV